MKRFFAWLAALVILFGVFAGYRAWQERQQEDAAQEAAEQQLDQFHPGDCLVLREQEARQKDGGPVPILADCSSPELTLTAGLKVLGTDTCPGTHYIVYHVSLGDKQYGALCLVENFHEGQCYAKSAVGQIHERVPCSTTATEEASVHDSRVVKTAEGSNDPSLCPDGTSPVAYPEPRRLYCMGSPVN